LTSTELKDSLLGHSPEALRFRFELTVRAEDRREFLRIVNSDQRLLEMWMTCFTHTSVATLEQAEDQARREYREAHGLSSTDYGALLERTHNGL
jgi:hypothetical protein